MPAPTGTNQLPDTVKTFYDTRLLRQAEPRLIHTLFADVDGIPKNNGETIEFRMFSALPTKHDSLIEGVTPTPDQLDMTKIEAASEQMGAFVTLTDRLLYTATDPVLLETNRLQGDQAGRSVDARVRSTLQQGTSVYRPNNRVTRGDIQAGDNITFDLLDRATVALEEAETQTFPEHGNRFVCLLHPKSAYALRQDPMWKDLVKSNPIDPQDRLASNYLGDTHGVRFFKSSATKVYPGAGVGSIDVFSTLLLGKGFYGICPLALLEWLVTQANDPLRQKNHAGWKVDFASLIKQDGYGVRLEHGNPI